MRAAQQSVKARQSLGIGAQRALFDQAETGGLLGRSPFRLFVEQQRIIYHPLQRITRCPAHRLL
ncbi:hypothetical protein D3C79_907470 [compost metagenome]